MKLKHFNLTLGTQIFKAFGDEARIRILHLVFKKKEMCISDLELVLEFTQTKISRHLIYLKNSDLVNYRKVDQWTFYSIKEEVEEFVDTMFRYLGKDIDLQKDLEIYNTLYSNRELAANKVSIKNYKP
jgi:ArsR family transcriptional regulator, arsenate/arsenite/antimonite-responsive transcriptional repressor